MLENMRLSEIYAAIETFAPLSFQEEYDHSGLQVGSFDADARPCDPELTGALVCLDVTEEVLREAAGEGCNLVISHHPLLFHPLAELSGESWQQRCVVNALRKGIAIYSAHTSLDNAEGGVSWEMARRIGLERVEFLVPRPDGGGSGAIGVLTDSVKDEAFAALLRRVFGVKCISHTPFDGRTIRKVALCGGSGAFLSGAARAAGADCFVTGEMGYHQFFDTEGLQAYSLGHFQSEQFTVNLLSERLDAMFPKARILRSSICTNPTEYFI